MDQFDIKFVNQGPDGWVRHRSQLCFPIILQIPVRFKLNKSGRDMLVPICGKLSEVFSRVPWPVEPHGLLFPEIDAKAMSIQVSRSFTRAGYPWFSFQKLRHTAACFLLDNDVPITTVSALLGHSSINVTMDFYARVRPRKLVEAVKKFDVL